MNTSKRLSVISCQLSVFAIATAVLFAGCAQNQGIETGQPAKQPTKQAIDTQTGTATDGSIAAINQTTNPHGRGLWNARGYEDVTDPGETEDGPPEGVDPNSIKVALAAEIKLPPWIDQSIHGNTSTITATTETGTTSTTPTVSGTVTPSIAPSATTTGGPMTQKPEVSTAVPITVSAAPGSSAQGGPTAATAGEGAQGGTQSNQQQATIDYLQQIVKGQGEQIAKILEALNKLAPPAPTTQPAGGGGS